MAEYAWRIPKGKIQGELILIFVILGTQRFQMNRVIDEIDYLVETGKIKKEDIIIQNGYSQPSKFVKCFQMVGEDQFDEILTKSEVVITHGGTSSIIKALKNGKKTIVIPRKAKFQEHVDDHQKEICDVFKEQGYAEVLDDIKQLGSTIDLIQTREYKQMNSSKELSRYIIDEVLKIN